MDAISKKAIRLLRTQRAKALLKGADPDEISCLDLAIKAIGERAERTSPKPLTLRELKQMEGDVVWVVVIDKEAFCDPKDTFSDWGHVRKSWVRLWDASRADIITVSHHFEDYNKTWIAYRYKPEGAQEENEYDQNYS